MVLQDLSFCCISFDSYIKPQLGYPLCINETGCISFDSYIKPQQCWVVWILFHVVYLLIPTSNHNRNRSISLSSSVVYLLIPTSNHNFLASLAHKLQLYIFWFLHQTTTSVVVILNCLSCISFDSYIKPQLIILSACWLRVVYLLIPTSNHNFNHYRHEALGLYIFWFLHQTTTLCLNQWSC